MFLCVILMQYVKTERPNQRTKKEERLEQSSGGLTGVATERKMALRQHACLYL